MRALQLPSSSLGMTYLTKVNSPGTQANQPDPEPDFPPVVKSGCEEATVGTADTDRRSEEGCRGIDCGSETCGSAETKKRVRDGSEKDAVAFLQFYFSDDDGPLAEGEARDVLTAVLDLVAGNNVTDEAFRLDFQAWRKDRVEKRP